MGVDLFRQWLDPVFFAIAATINLFFIFMKFLGIHVVRRAVDITALAAAFCAQLIISIFVHGSKGTFFLLPKSRIDQEGVVLYPGNPFNYSYSPPNH